MKNKTNILLVILIILVAVGIFKNHSLDLNVSEHRNNVIRISGKAEKDVVPDVAKISFSVNEYNKSQKVAANKVNKKTKAVIEALKHFGIEEADIKTKKYSIYPEYNWNDGKKDFRDYKVSQSVNVKIRDLEKLNEIIAKVTELKIDNFNGPNMFVDDRDEVMNGLREEAIKNAKSKAKKLASELGVKLSKIISFSENSNRGDYDVRPMYSMKLAMDEASNESIETPEINPGQEKIVKTVSIAFQIED